MKSLFSLTKLANKFRIIIADQSAQAGDIETALKAANLWDLSKDVAPLVAASGIPDSCSIDIKINVSEGPAVSFSVITSPESVEPSKALEASLLKKFASTMTTALSKAGLNVTQIVTVNWLKF